MVRLEEFESQSAPGRVDRQPIELPLATGAVPCRVEPVRAEGKHIGSTAAKNSQAGSRQ
jgi:hypothetical protein